MEYAENDETKLIFHNPQNEQLRNLIEKMKEQLSNPYVDLYEWLEEEEIEIEAMLEALSSFDGLLSSFDKLSEKSDSLDQDIKSIQFGQKGFKNMFRNKETALAEKEASKKKTEEEIEILHSIIRYSAFNMECYLEYFKNDKLNDYYRHLKIFATLQKQNDQVLNNLWETVSKDKNMVENAQLSK